jgi:NAD(P)-dependent dehydrogenase (short-subunit alcohol dehydrogenase family)
LEGEQLLSSDPAASHGAKVATLFDVRGLSVIITGGASGIGLAMARALVTNGARVTILDANGDALEQELPALRLLGEACGARADICDTTALQAGISKAAEFGGGVNVLFANAGADFGVGFLDLAGVRAEAGVIEGFDEADWNKGIALNLTGVMRTIKAVVPFMKRGGGGRIIVTTSIASIVVNGLASLSYFPAKAGAAHLVRRLALELATHGILVNSIAPGGVATNIAKGMLTDPQVIMKLERAIPLHRIGKPEDLQGLALFLCAPASSYITGAQFVIDGGAALGVAD